tara:strand:+ start:1329 stop:1544 length:216 start_codon:yes stop_codon:yes gene_type:complete
MGPYSEETQTQRAANIEKLLLNKDNSKEVRRMWKHVLNNLARTEEEYNRRVVALYGDKKWNQSIGMLVLTS